MTLECYVDSSLSLLFKFVNEGVYVGVQLFLYEGPVLVPISVAKLQELQHAVVLLLGHLLLLLLHAVHVLLYLGIALITGHLLLKSLRYGEWLTGIELLSRWLDRMLMLSGSFRRLAI